MRNIVWPHIDDEVSAKKVARLGITGGVIAIVGLINPLLLYIFQGYDVRPIYPNPTVFLVSHLIQLVFVLFLMFFVWIGKGFFLSLIFLAWIVWGAAVVFRSVDITFMWSIYWIMLIYLAFHSVRGNYLLRKLKSEK